MPDKPTQPPDQLDQIPAPVLPPAPPPLKEMVGVAPKERGIMENALDAYRHAQEASAGMAEFMRLNFPIQAFLDIMSSEGPDEAIEYLMNWMDENVNPLLVEVGAESESLGRATARAVERVK